MQNEQPHQHSHSSVERGGAHCTDLSLKPIPNFSRSGTLDGVSVVYISEIGLTLCRDTDTNPTIPTTAEHSPKSAHGKQGGKKHC